MLYEAFFWSGTERPPLDDVRRRPEFSSLLAGWGRAGDSLLIAEHAGAGAGAAWFRLWTSDVHSYGFVDADTPELGLAVVQGLRRRGVGRMLLRQLIQRATELGYEALSLSVAPANPARRLYESEGFHKVGEAGTSWTLLLELRP
jgi:ribosomal protein S18 acetylase RimI-like enzyme